MLNRLLAADQPAGVQQAALSALGDYTAPDIAHDILARWSEFTPEMRTRAADIMLSRKSWALEILEAVSRERVAISHWNQEQRQRLLEHPVGAVRRRAKRLLRDRGTADRRGVVEYFRANMPDSGDASAGETTFQKHCAACHRIAGRGHAVGPDLTSVASLDVDALLVHILDPNDYVLPKYVQYMVLDAQGRIHTGMIASQTATSVTLVRDRQESRTVLRSHIDDMRGTDKSLMPEGFEEKISPPDMADLIAFLVETGRQPGAKHADDGHADDGQARRDFGTLPGLIEPDDESE